MLVAGFRLPTTGGRDKTGDSAVVLEDAELQWPNETPLLRPMTFTVPSHVQGQSRAHLTVVLGAVGTGKSGLLQVRGCGHDPPSTRILHAQLSGTNDQNQIRGCESLLQP